MSEISIQLLLNFSPSKDVYLLLHSQLVSVLSSEYGFLLLFSANQSSSLVLTPYPPLGASTVTVLILATFLIFVGIYKSAVLASTNVELRNTIYRIAKDSKILNLFGKAENEREIKNTVTKIINYSQNTSPEVAIHNLDELELKKIR